MQTPDGRTKILLMAMGVCDAWDPLEWFKVLRTAVPLARILGFATPTRTSRALVEAWAKEPRATLGLYGFHGVTFEAFDWTLGGAYLRLRRSFELGPYSSFFFAPDGALSDEAIALLGTGDTHIPVCAIVGEASSVIQIPDRFKILPWLSKMKAESPLDFPVGVFISPTTALNELANGLNSNAHQFFFADPHHCVIESTGPAAPMPTTPIDTILAAGGAS